MPTTLTIHVPTRERLLALLEQDGLSAWDAGQLLIALGASVQTAAAVLTEVDGSIRHDVSGLLATAERMVADIGAAADAVTEATADASNRIHAAGRKLREADAELTSTLRMRPSVNVPHDLDALITVAERLSGLSDDQFTRLIALADALRDGK